MLKHLELHRKCLQFDALRLMLPKLYTSGSCEARKHLEPCKDIKDRSICLTAIDNRKNTVWDGSPCGWCFGKPCPGPGNLCEPKVWFQKEGLKEGVQYEECLPQGKIKSPKWTLKWKFDFLLVLTLTIKKSHPGTFCTYVKKYLYESKVPWKHAFHKLIAGKTHW